MSREIELEKQRGDRDQKNTTRRPGGSRGIRKVISSVSKINSE